MVNIDLTIFFICFCQKFNNDENEEDTYTIQFDEKRPKKMNLLSTSWIESAREERFKEVEMWSFLREAFIYVLFIIFLFALIYSTQTTINEYWTWLNQSFTQNIRAQQWYNNDQPKHLSGFINDKSNRIYVHMENWIWRVKMILKKRIDLKSNKSINEFNDTGKSIWI